MAEDLFKEDREETEEDSADFQTKKKNFFSKLTDYLTDFRKSSKLFIFLGFFALILGAWNMTSYIKNAFVESPFVLKDKAALSQNLNRLKDTDSDGISDYDELNTYGTSPYLEDTDSDGISDYDEIVSGGDPLCSGENCNLDIMEDAGISFEMDFLNTDMASMDLEQMKNMLIESGYSEEEVNQLTQEDLNNIYLQAQKAVSDEGYEFQADSEQGDIEDVQNLSAEDVRNLLIQAGASSEQLNAISDEELIQLYKEVLGEMED